MDFLEKLDLLMKRDNYNKNTLSKASNIPYTTIDNWYKRGYDNLQLPTLKKLCSFFHTSLDFWLKEDITDPDYGKANGFEISYQEMEHIKKYRCLDPQGKETVSYILDRETERVNQLSQQDIRIRELEAQTTPTRIITYYQRLASAGTGEYLFPEIPTDTITVKDTPVSRAADFVIGVNGHSMEPDYSDGEKVFVKKTDELNIGEVGIFVQGNQCYIKELGETHLISRNKECSDIIPVNDVYLVGKVIGKVEE